MAMSLQVVTERNALLADFFGALMVHAIYRRFEVDPVNALATSALLLGVPGASSYLLFSSYGSIFKAILIGFSIFYATLIGSIVLYRISPLHPLANYPGPFLAKISKFYALRIMATGKNHLYHKSLHEKYGPYVRVGPNELSVVDGEHISEVLGGSGLPRGPMWDARRNPHGSRSLLAIRDQREHARRRKPWNRAFSITAIKDYEPSVQKRAHQLIRELEKKAKAGTTVDLSEWMKSFTFDFMGDLVFGGGFEAMQNGIKNEPILHAIESGLKAMAVLQHIPWVILLLSYLPGSTKTIDVLRAHSAAKVNKRRAEGSYARDLYSYFMDESVSEKDRPTETEMVSDGLLAIIAGYDTTATVLAALFHYILCDRNVYLRLQEEVDKYFKDAEGSMLDSSRLATLPYLSAVISEALRLGCPADVIQRSTTSETGAKYLGQRYIPEGTAIQIPLYSLLRDPTAFSPSPEEFRPERFLDTNTTAKAFENGDATKSAQTNLTAFIPFSYGPENCAGRTLAMAELRVITVLMMRHFDVKLADGYDPADWQRDLEDWYVMSVGKVPVQLSLRSSVPSFD